MTSLRGALLLLGDRGLRKWASIVAMATLGHDRPPELILTTLAAFCENLLQDLGRHDLAEPRFLAGLFSTIDAFLGQPLSETLGGLSLPRLRAEIERIARRTRRSFSEVAQALLEEAVRTRECPGIYFADEPAGRAAKVAGTGLGVWEVVRDSRPSRAARRSCGGGCLIFGRLSSRRRPSTTRGFPEEIDAEIADDIGAHAEGRTMQEAIARRA